jgi:hypothetical protein
MASLLPGTSLEPGRVVPGVELEDRGGPSVRVWDHRQRSALALSFLHADCAACDAFQRRLEAEAASELDVTRSRAVAVRNDGSPALSRFLGEAEPPVLVIVDRYGAAWRSYPASGHDFPEPSEVAATLWHLATMCPECGDTAWND